MQDSIFAPTTLGGIQLRNRIIRAATDESMGDANGFPTDKLTALYERLAKGEVGAIITGYIAVAENGKSTFPGMCTLETDDKIPAYMALTDAVHQYGTPIIAQIAHCGAQGAARYGKVCALKEDEIRTIIRQFIDAAIRASKAGFDGVELHCAHGYLLSEFLSPKKNKRRDSWGGSAENRFRIVDEILRGIKTVLPQFPVWVKLNGTEKGGITEDQAAGYAAMMEQAGADAIEVSCGLSEDVFMFARGRVPFDMICHDYPAVKNLPAPLMKLAKPLVNKILEPPAPKRLYNLSAARRIKAKVHVPVIVVGGIHDLHEIESVIGGHGLDAVSLSRPLILEPTLVQKYKSGKQSEAKCIECNYCVIGISQRPLRCYYGKLPND